MSSAVSAESIGLTPTAIARFWAHVSATNANGCRLWTGGGRGVGYGAMKIGRKVYDAHRVAWLIRHGSIPAGGIVRHRCDVKLCVHHVEIGTSKDNHSDMVRRGRAPSAAHLSRRLKEIGHQPPPQRLFTEEQVRSIRERVRRGERPAAIAALFGVCRPTITRIANGTSYRHVRTSPPSMPPSKTEAA